MLLYVCSAPLQNQTKGTAMTTTTIRVGIKCSCGGDLEVPKDKRASDILTCVKCGASGKHSDAVRQAGKHVTALIDKQLKASFRKAGFK
jgi:hypothetical protein